MPRSAKTMGRDAIVSVLAKFIHPSEHIRKAYPNANAQLRIDGLLVLRMESKKVSRRNQLCVIFVSQFIKDSSGNHIELYCVKRYARVESEGSSEFFFDSVNEEVVEEAVENEELPIDIFTIENRGTVLNDDVAMIRGAGISVDDDNEPVEENIPREGEAVGDVFDNRWGHSGICPRRSSCALNNNPRMNTSKLKPSRLQLFEMFIPKQYLISVVIVETNKKIEGDKLTYGELLRWLGLQFMMATIQGFQRRDFWSTQVIDTFETAPFRFNEIMSRDRFDNILKALTYTDRVPPVYKDPFWEVRQLIEAWNQNMTENFIPSWILCLDESMMRWINKYTCPGFMFVPRKPWPFGNEFHTIACGISGILWRLEIVEGKDQPAQEKKEFSEHGKTVGLLLRLTKPIWGTGSVVVLDSGFCVVKGIVALKKKGIFSAALIKKRKYWPKYIDGDRIKSHFDDKPVGSVDALEGNINGNFFHVFAMKEPDYVMMLMSTYGTLNRQGEDKHRQTNTGKITFKYPEVVHNHYKYRDSVDCNNARRQSPIALEITWATKRWANRVFAYLIATSEVNSNLAEASFVSDKETADPQLKFRRGLARDLINNPFIIEGRDGASRRQSKRQRQNHGHKLVKIPAGYKFQGTQLVKSKSMYPFNWCFCKSARVREYCICTKGKLLCKLCFATHCLEVEMAD